MIGNCNGGNVSALYHDSIMGVLFWDHANHARILSHGGRASVIGGPRIHNNRHDLVNAFLSEPKSPEWLWITDSDMVFEPDTLERLLAAADSKTRPVVGGLCFGGGRDKYIFPTLYVLEEREGCDQPDWARLEDYPRDALVQVDGTGTACLLVHRSVFTRMAEKFPAPYPWFAETVLNGKGQGEDLTFCYRLRAMNIPVFVDTRIKVGHQKSWVIAEDSFDEWKARQES